MINFPKSELEYGSKDHKFLKPMEIEQVRHERAQVASVLLE